MDPDPEPLGRTDSRARTALAQLTSSVSRLSPERCQEVDAAVDRNFEGQQLALVEKLVNQPSYSRAKEDVEAAARLLDAAVEDLGWQIEKVADPDAVFADHRVYRPRGLDDSRPALALVGHIDTVFPRSLGFLEFRRELDSAGQPGDNIFGPGVLDMKTGLSCIYSALRVVKTLCAERFDTLPVRWICNSDEEVGSPSSAALFAARAENLFGALVFEAGRVGDKIVTRRKGSANFRITAHGKAAHAGNDHASGRNAIHALALLVPHIEALTDYQREVTVNIGIFQGGTARNTVPESASLEIDSRFARREDALALVKALEDLCARPPLGQPVPERLQDVRFTVETRIARLPMEASEYSQQLRLAYESCVGGLGLSVGEAGLQGGGSDANLLSAAGVPSIDGLGPFGKFFHQTTEWSSLSSLRAKTKALARMLVALSDGQGASSGS